MVGLGGPSEAAQPGLGAVAVPGGEAVPPHTSAGTQTPLGGVVGGAPRPERATTRDVGAQTAGTLVLDLPARPIWPLRQAPRPFQPRTWVPPPENYDPSPLDNLWHLRPYLDTRFPQPTPTFTTQPSPTPTWLQTTTPWLYLQPPTQQQVTIEEVTPPLTSAATPLRVVVRAPTLRAGPRPTVERPPSWLQAPVPVSRPVPAPAPHPPTTAPPRLPTPLPPGAIPDWLVAKPRE